MSGPLGPKEPMQSLAAHDSLLPYGKKILICRHLSSMLAHDAVVAPSSYHLKDSCIDLATQLAWTPT